MLTSPCSCDDPERFDLLIEPLTATILRIDGGDVEEVALYYGAYTVRLSVTRGSMLDGPVHLSFELDGRRTLDKRLLTLRRFSALLRAHHIPRTLTPPNPRVQRWALLLRTLDALGQDTRQRAVGTALFGEERMAEDWLQGAGYLRLRVRRLIDQARRLVAGDYLRMLG